MAKIVKMYANHNFSSQIYNLCWGAYSSLPHDQESKQYCYKTNRSVHVRFVIQVSQESICVCFRKTLYISSKVLGFCSYGCLFIQLALCVSPCKQLKSQFTYLQMEKMLIRIKNTGGYLHSLQTKKKKNKKNLTFVSSSFKKCQQYSPKSQVYKAESCCQVTKPQRLSKQWRSLPLL
jgi:hypothetical protein